jgi:hypothetical protein
MAIRSSTQVSPAFALKKNSPTEEIVEMLSILVSQVSEAMTERISSVYSSIPYQTGAVLLTQTASRTVIQVMATGTLPSTSPFSFVLFSDSPIEFPNGVVILSIVGVAQNSSTGVAYPIGYYDGTNFISAYVDTANQLLVVSYSALFFGYTLNVVVTYA